MPLPESLSFVLPHRPVVGQILEACGASVHRKRHCEFWKEKEKLTTAEKAIGDSLKLTTVDFGNWSVVCGIIALHFVSACYLPVCFNAQHRYSAHVLYRFQI